MDKQLNVFKKTGENREIFLMENFQLTSVEGMGEMEYHQQITSKSCVREYLQ